MLSQPRFSPRNNLDGPAGSEKNGAIWATGRRDG